MLVPIDNLGWGDEVPLRDIPNEKHWSEDYCFFGHDIKSNVGLYLHLGRWAQDLGIWRKQVYIYLPDGTSLSGAAHRTPRQAAQSGRHLV
jgi:hypothetical protein